MKGDLYRRLRSWLKRWVFRGRQEQELAAEMEFHREQLIAQFRAEGMTQREAELAARREFGAFADAYQEEARDAWRPMSLSAMLRDLRLAFRAMRRSPGFSVLAILTLGLGIGACTTMFSVIQSTVRSALPVAEQDRLFFFWEDNAALGIDQFSQSVPNFVDYREQTTSFESLIGTSSGNVSLATGNQAARHAQAVQISAGFSRTFGWPMLVGRDFLAAEDVPGGEAIAIISERLWRDAFQAREDVVGREVLIDRTPHRIVGVVGAQADLYGETDVFRPLRPDASAGDRDNHWLTVVGKLKPGVTVAQAEAEIDLIAASLRAQYPDTMKGWDAHLELLADQLIPPAWRQGLNLLLGAVGLLLLIACANVANLLLSRSLMRERELAIRTSLGATRGQLARQLLSETFVLAAAGAVLGVVLAYWGLEAVRALAPSDLPRIDEIAISGPSLAFAGCACVACTLIAGLLPALKGSQTTPAPNLGGTAKAAGGTLQRSRLRDTLVVVQVALSLTLLVGSGLVLRSFARLSQVDPGFDASGVLTFQIAPDEATYRTGADMVSLFERLHDKLSALPGVTGVAQTSGLPFGDGRTSLNVFPVDPAAVPAEESVQASWRIVDADYFDVLRIPLTEGRAFTARDNDWEAPTIIISRRLAERFWPGQSALGKRVNPGGGDAHYTVVGVAEDIRLRDLSGASENPQMYFPTPLWAGWRHQSFAVRTVVPPETLGNAVQDAVRTIDPAQPIFGLNTLASLAQRDLRLPRLSAWLLSIFATLALLLAAIGLYAVMSTAVAQRTREIGVRMALGAQRRAVVAMVLSHGGRLVVLGTVAGLLLSMGAARALSAGLYGSPTFDLVVFGVAALVLVGTAALSLLLPARRAAGVDPVVALRSE
ncbi:ABC transporter permease [Actomonas aquatica]|uniref:ABC transporter permease n=1 Tax=Actomonas aquatica TaxID=2866162 RepID=A0ABZ1CAG3_9BACT|nr:ABC transporter permease [Opitutus sp. WL0086]WRQ88382.1 ABC transporter permease [Opitutus sp. WL0086]